MVSSVALNLTRESDSSGDPGRVATQPTGDSIDQVGVLAGLTPAERRVFAILTEGKSNKEIAAALVLSDATVRSHLTRIYSKLEVRGRSGLLATVARASPQVAPAGDGQVPSTLTGRPGTWVLAAAAASAALLALIFPVTLLISGPVLLGAAVLVYRRSGRPSNRWLGLVVLSIGVVLFLGAVIVSLSLLALLGSG